VGREKNFIVGLLEQIKALIVYKKIGLTYQQDQEKSEDFIRKNFSGLENPAINAKLVYDSKKDDFSITQAKTGEIFDRENLSRELEARLASLNRSPIELIKIIDLPKVTEDKNNKAKIRAKEIAALTPIQLEYNDSTWPIEKAELIGWLDFIPVAQKDQTMDIVISEISVQNFLTELAPSVNRETVNANLALNDGKVVAFALSQNGRKLKIQESAKKISQDILARQKEVSLIIEETKPEITTDTIDTLGLTSLIGQGVSDFAGSPKNRTHNIGVGAARFNGVLIEPGQDFSFNEILGEVSAKEGYLPELVIKGNKTIPEYGGGICQISTTLFRAAINSGLKITERYPHAFPVKYYNPQGFDATIYPPHPDLRFINDTPNNILIQSKIIGTKITFELYGTKDDREIKVNGPIILESNPDGSMKTILYQEIWRNGELERKDTFRSNYKSPALYPVQRNPLE
ncbi:MAG: VanW family protein, partial [Candidatus Portnoybacteria bacterium]|nr:VanW family protein [Candidatus Portnoybacteria bacterium]